MTLPPLIDARGVTKRFDGVTAVDSVDFTLAPCELRCLIGPNGAGKSTFFKMLTGQLRPSAGSIRLNGEEIGGQMPHRIARRGVGIKTQVPNVFDGLSVRENIHVAAARLSRRPNTAVDEVLTRLQLTAIAHRDTGLLAHGQRQWVELAMVLVQAPQLILLDEPAAGMSREETARTAALLQEVRRTQALVVVEHDMAFIRSLASPVTVFDRGRILTEGPAAQVLADPRVQAVYLGKRKAA